MPGFSQLTEGLVGQPMFNILTKVTAMEAAGRKVYRFEVGDSDFDAHPHVVEATKKALDDGHTRYVSSLGIEPLRQAISDHAAMSWGFRPELNQVAVLPSNSIIDFVVRTVADPGDEVIFSDPGFPSYYAVTSYLGVKDVRVPIYEKNGFRLNPDDLATRITDKTRLIILNTPQNPTGAMMTREEVEAVAEIARKNDLWLLSDEIYSENVYDGETHYSPSSIDPCKDRTIILHGFSKGYSMSGWRLGYAIGPESFMNKLALMFQTVYSCLPPFVQYAGISALLGDRALMRKRMAFYQRLRDVMVDELNNIPGVSCLLPKGAIYAFPNISGTGLSSHAFTMKVLDECGVAVVPGSVFGPSGEGYVRLCYLREETMIKEACAAIRSVL